MQAGNDKYYVCHQQVEEQVADDQPERRILTSECCLV